MPIIKVTDIAYGRIEAPDLDRQEEFLLNFGMVRADRTKTALYMRGTGPNHHVHVTQLGGTAYIGLAFYAASEEDLEKVSKVPGASAIETIDEPGGGKRVRLTDPDGYKIDVVHGIEKVAPLPVKRGYESNLEARRPGELCRPKIAPSQVKRAGHAVIVTPQIGKVLDWYRGTLGFLCSDELYEGEKSNTWGSFNRVDRGADYVDHHVMFIIKSSKRKGLQHLAFEVDNVDDVMVGHEFLRQNGHHHVRGIGRHLLGGQIFDYWSDPWGRLHEHWVDTDYLNATAQPEYYALGSPNVSWGDRGGPEFQNSVYP